MFVSIKYNLDFDQFNIYLSSLFIIILMKNNKQKWKPPLNQMTNKPLQFSYEELVELRRKFKHLSGEQNFIYKQNFDKNLGIFGSSATNSFSDRLFNSFDIDQDSKISIEDYNEYMEVLKCGSIRHKALISFRLIDIQKKQTISYQDFSLFLKDYFDSWLSITLIQSNKQLEMQANQYLLKLFEEVFKKTGKYEFDFQFYAKNVYGTKQFMDAFSFVSDDVASIFIENDENDPVGFSYYETLRSINQIYKQNLMKELVSMGKIEEEQSTEDSELQIVKSKLRRIQNGLSAIIKKTEEDYRKYRQKYEIKRTDKKIDIEAIIMNIPKNPTPQSYTPGHMILFGDQKWNFMLNMMIGIQKAVTSLNNTQKMSFQIPDDFELKNRFQLPTQRFGDQTTVKNHFTFTDFAPNAFNQIRKDLKIRNADYINSIGVTKVMKSFMTGELSSLTQYLSEGKSGSLFYHTADGKYLLKTIKEREYLLLIKIMKNYYFYLKENPKSLLIKYLGLHKLELQNKTKNEQKEEIYFVIMENFLNTGDKILDKYDLKGSTLGRKNDSNDPNFTKKDLDFLENRPGGVILQPQLREELLTILEKDTTFLKSQEIIDYSLLLTFCERQTSLFEEILGVKYENKSEKSNIIQTKQNERLILGVIDILIEYDIVKSMEYHFKKIFDGQGASAAPPQDYASRFTQFIQTNVFPKQSKEKQMEKI